MLMWELFSLGTYCFKTWPDWIKLYMFVMRASNLHLIANNEHIIHMCFVYKKDTSHYLFKCNIIKHPS